MIEREKMISDYIALTIGWLTIICIIITIVVIILMISIPINLSKLKEEQKETNRILIETLNQNEKIIQELKRIK